MLSSYSVHVTRVTTTCFFDPPGSCGSQNDATAYQTCSLFQSVDGHSGSSGLQTDDTGLNGEAWLAAPFVCATTDDPKREAGIWAVHKGRKVVAPLGPDLPVGISVTGWCGDRTDSGQSFPNLAVTLCGLAC